MVGKVFGRANRKKKIEKRKIGAEKTSPLGMLWEGTKT